MNAGRIALLSLMLPLAALPVSRAPAEGPDAAAELRRAARLEREGYVDRAGDIYRRVLAEGAQPVASATGLARCLDQLGRYEDGLAVLAGTSAEGERDAAWRLVHGQLLERLGRYEEALAHWRAALEREPAHMAARWALGSLLERLGRREEAIDVYAWFDERVRSAALPQRAEELVLLGRGYDRYSVLTQHPEIERRTTFVLHDLYQRAYEMVDRGYWPGRIAAGELLLSKDTLPQAQEEFEAARRINPWSAEVHVGLGRVALARWDFDGAERRVESALGLNDRDGRALHLLADLRMTERRYDQAVEACGQALRVNPNDIEALSTLAAAELLRGRAEASETAQQRVAAISPRCAQLHFTLAEWLSGMRQYPEAEAAYRRAIEIAPEWAQARSQLGLMYMQSGDEAAARRVLDEAWLLDPFNRGTFNTLKLLDRLDAFDTLESEHFIVRFDKRHDAVLAPYITHYLESIYEEVCADYGHEPTEKTIIEVFPTHAEFGVRITGRPWIWTIGACTGRVIAVDAPRPSSGFGRYFNWAEVLRHEYTHTVTLSATHNRIPHWFTEGLAVLQEDSPRQWSWVTMLAGALRLDRLFDLQQIDWAFVRPRRPDDRQLAYAQSEWMTQYIVARYGYGAIEKLLAAFRAGRAQEAAFGEVLGVSTARFFADFKMWAREDARAWGLPVAPLPGVVWLKAVRLLRPNDADNLALLAERQALEGEYGAAREAADAALKIDDAHAGALEVLCGLYLLRMEEEDKTETRRVLWQHVAESVAKLLEVDGHNRVGLRLRAQAALDEGRDEEALRDYALLRTTCPYDPVSYRRLAAIYLQRGQREEALGALIDMWSYQSEDPDVAVRVGELLLDAGRERDALMWFERGLHIDPYRRDVHERLGALYKRLERWEDALREYEALSVLEPDKAVHSLEAAQLQRRLGKVEE